MKAFAGFLIPVTYGDFALFPNFIGKIVSGELFREYMNEGTSKFENRKSFLCEVREYEEGGVFADLIGPQPRLLTRDMVLSILAYLGRQGRHYLDIPYGKDEVTVLIGYVDFAGHWYVLYLIHRKEEILVRMETSDEYEEGVVRVINVSNPGTFGWTEENPFGEHGEG